MSSGGSEAGVGLHGLETGKLRKARAMLNGDGGGCLPWLLTTR